MFLIIPVGVQYTARRYPVVTFTLMGINAALYLVSLVLWVAHLNGSVSEESSEWLIEHLGLVPAQMTWYAFITSMFVHAGFFHFAGNMIYLFLFGSCVEDSIGRWQYGLFYLIGGFGAALTYILMVPSGAHAALAVDGETMRVDMIPMVGASGAISACIGGFLLLLAKTKINFRYLFFFFFRLFSGDFWLPTWLVISFWFLTDLFWALVSYSKPEANDGTAFAAHVGGTLAGIAMMAGWKVYQRYAPAGRDAEDTMESLDAQVIAVPVPVAVESPSIYLSQDGNQIGPFTPSQVRQMIALGSVSSTAYFWRDGMAEWRAVAEFAD